MTGGARRRTTPMLSKEQTNFRNAPRPDEASCGICKHFRPPESCALVVGLITPTSLSDLFERKPGAKPFTYDDIGGDDKIYVEGDTMDATELRKFFDDGLGYLDACARELPEGPARRKVEEVREQLADLRARHCGGCPRGDRALAQSVWSRAQGA
jgi:hypothetical protein